MRGALLYAIFSSFLFQDAGCFIEVAGLTVDLHRAVCHCTGDEVKVVGTVLVGIPALDHLAVGIIADPLAAVRFLVNILGNCLCAVGIAVQPVPAITFGVIDLLAAAFQALALAVLVPVVLAVLPLPGQVQTNACLLYTSPSPRDA